MVQFNLIYYRLILNWTVTRELNGSKTTIILIWMNSKKLKLNAKLLLKFNMTQLAQQNEFLFTITILW